MSRRRLSARLTGRLFVAGRAAYRAGRFERARWLFRIESSLFPDDRIARLYLARSQRELGNLEQALAIGEKGLDRIGSWAPLVRVVVDLQVRLGRADAARATLASAADPERADEQTLLELWPLLIKHAPALAVEVADDMTARDPAGSTWAASLEEATTAVGERIADAGDEDAALGVAGRFEASDDPTKQIVAVRLYAQLGRTGRAFELLQALPEGADPEKLFSTAQLLWRQGFARKALELLEPLEDSQASTLRRRIESRLEVLRGRRPQLPATAIEPLPGRVLHLAHASLPHQVSGYTVRTHQTARAQLAAGLEPHVVTRIGFPDGVTDSGPEIVDGIPYHRVIGPPSGVLEPDERLAAAAEQVLAALAHIRPQVLHAASDYENAMLALALRDASGIPVVYEVRGFWEDTWLARQPASSADSDVYELRREINTRCMNEADHVVTLGDTMKREIAGRGVSAEKLSVVGNAIDAEIGEMPRDDVTAARLGIEPGEVVIGYVGSLLAYEGLDRLIEAVAELPSDRRVKCLIVGDGPERSRLAALARRLGVSDRVVMTGGVPPDATPRYYSLLDIYAMPRRDDRVCSLVSPLKPYEAMATHSTLVVSDLPPLREIVADGETGLVVEAGSTAALARALGRLVDEPELRSSLARDAFELVRRERSWSRNATAYKRIYEGLQGG